MKQTLSFARSIGTVTVPTPAGGQVRLPVIPGILKHPACDTLPALLANPQVAHKYTILALQEAAWPILRQFPRDWLLERLEAAQLSPSRKRAVLFLLA